MVVQSETNKKSSSDNKYYYIIHQCQMCWKPTKILYFIHENKRHR